MIKLMGWTFTMLVVFIGLLAVSDTLYYGSINYDYWMGDDEINNFRKTLHGWAGGSLVTIGFIKGSIK